MSGEFLFMEDVAERAGVDPATIRYYNTRARLKRRKGKATPADLPPAAKRVNRKHTRADGAVITAPTPVWREADITLWLTHHKPRAARRDAESA